MNKAEKLTLVEENLWDLYKNVANQLQIPFEMTNGYSFVRSHPSPWPDFIFGIHKPYEKALQNTLVSGMEERELPPFIISSPKNSLTGFEKDLNMQGIKLVIKWPAMHRDLTTIPLKNTDFIKLFPVNTLNDMEVWLDLASSNLFSGKNFEKKFVSMLNIPSCRFFLLKREESNMGTVLLNLKDKTSGIYMVSVNEKERRKGIGTEMMKAVLHYLCENGVKNCVLEANQQSTAFYEKLGFENLGNFEIYWKIGLF